MVKLIQESNKLLDATKALKAMKTASRIAEENSISDMTLDEINAEIAKSRK